MATNISGTTGVDKASWAQNINGFRLTLTSGTPVTTADVTGATTIYCTPYKGNSIALYDGSMWQVRQSAEFSLALGTLTSGKPYDVFCYDNAGTPTLEFLVWTNDTTRATALAYQDGVLVKSGAATRRYLGTFYTTGVATTEDSDANRYLYNYYHRVSRKMRRLESTATWTYSSGTWRQANNSASNQLNFVQGVAEDSIRTSISATSSHSVGGQIGYVAIGLDNTTTPDPTDYPATVIWGSATQITFATVIPPQVGRHYIVWLESATASGTFTWYGGSLRGIIGEVMA